MVPASASFSASVSDAEQRHGIQKPQRRALRRRGGAGSDIWPIAVTDASAGSASCSPAARAYDDRSGRRPRAFAAADAAKSLTRNDNSNSIACASSDLISTDGAGAVMIELLLRSAVCNTSETADGAVVGAMRIRSFTPWLRFGLLRLVSLALARTLLGTHDEIVRSVEQMGRPPVGLDHPALQAVAEHDPVANLVGFAEIQRDARRRRRPACSAARGRG